MLMFNLFVSIVNYFVLDSSWSFFYSSQEALEKCRKEYPDEFKSLEEKFYDDQGKPKPGAEEWLEHALDNEAVHDQVFTEEHKTRWKDI